MPIVHDLKAASRSFDSELYVGAVFYMSRVVENVVGETWQNVFEGEGEGGWVYNNIVELFSWGVLDDDTAAMANAIRRAGNDVRHYSTTPTGEDVIVLGACLVLLLSHLAKLNSPVAPECLSGVSVLKDHPSFFTRAASLEKIAKGAQGAHLGESIKDTWLGSSAVAVVMGVAARCLPAQGLYELTVPALDLHPRNTRLKQLHAFALGKLGRYDEGIRSIQHLLNPDDQETTGIAGGIRKREWFDCELPDKRRKIALDYAKRRYGEAWKCSEGRNTYVGLNYAACSLWQGETGTCSEVARAVQDRLHARADKAGKHFHSPMQNEWDRLNLLEAHLLAGDTDDALDELDDIEVNQRDFSPETFRIVMHQIKQHLPYLQLPSQLEARIDQLLAKESGGVDA